MAKRPDKDAPISADFLAEELENLTRLKEEYDAGKGGSDSADQPLTDYEGVRNYLEHLPSLLHNPVVAELAHLFPSLQDAPHLDPFDEYRFRDWMDNEASPQAKHAAHFVLCVWENAPRSFDLAAAFRDWDTEHREAYAAWFQRPLMPQRYLWGRLP